MIDLVQEQILLSPTARAWVRQAVDDLVQGHCHLLLRPVLGDGEMLCNAVLEQLQRSHYQYEHLDVGVIDGKRLPVSLLEYFRIERSGNLRDPVEACQEALGTVDVLQVAGLDTQPLELQRRWLEFAVMWGRTCQRRQESGQHTTVLFGVTSLAPELLANIDSDVRLKLAWWWGVPSCLEVHILCRAAENGQLPEPETAWREHQAASLASGDGDFLGCIWPLLTAPLPELRASITRYGQQLNWSPDRLRMWITAADARGMNGWVTPRTRGIAAIEPPLNLRSLWREGVVYYSREHGCELHTAALVILGDGQGLAARLWRGQATLILPRLDAVRYRVCHELTERHGPTWPTRWSTPESAEERAGLQASPFACQWGYLRHLLLVVPQLKREGRQLLPLAITACNLRNDLAHCRPVQYSLFERFSREADQRLD